MKVEWSQDAIADLDRILERGRDKAAARRLINKIYRRARQLEIFPNSGRVVPEYGVPEIRELIDRPFRIQYRVGTDRVDIFLVVHGAMDLRPEESAEGTGSSPTN